MFTINHLQVDSNEIIYAKKDSDHIVTTSPWRFHPPGCESPVPQCQCLDTRKCDKFSSYGYLTSSNDTTHIHDTLLHESTHIFLGHFAAIRRIHEFRVISAATLVGRGSQSSHCRHHPHFLHHQLILQALKNTNIHIQYYTKTHSIWVSLTPPCIAESRLSCQTLNLHPTFHNWLKNDGNLGALRSCKDTGLTKKT